MNQRLHRCSFLLFLFLFNTLTLFAQQRTVKGVVTNQDNREPLAGVTVGIKGSDKSTTTNEKGEFAIPVSGNETVLKFTYVGFSFQEFPIGDKSNLTVLMGKDNKELDEVIVVGYGTQKKAHLTGAVETLKATEIEDLPVGNLGAALAGRMLGLNVSGGTARPGTSASLTIRNPRTLSKDGGNLEPLYVIDGVIQIGASGLSDNTLFNSLDPSEVETITILKDASAAIYGSRGANGVVLVQTKRGKAGPPRISYSGQFGWNDESYRTKMMSAYDFGRYFNIMNGPSGANANPGVDNFFTPDELERFKNIDYDWLDPVWKSSTNMRHTLNVSGGANKATYFANVSYYTQNGNLSTLDYDKWTFRAGSDVNVANNFKAGLQVSGNYSNRVKTFNKIGGENDENDYRNLLLAPRYIPMYVNGMPVRLPGTDALSQYHYYEIQRLNNLAESSDRMMTVNLYAEYEVPFIKGLKARGSYARNFGSGRGTQVGTSYRLYEFNRTGVNAHIYDSGATVRSSAIFKNGDRLYYSNQNRENQQLNFNVNYARQFGQHNISGLFSVEKSEASSSQEDVWKEAPIAATNGQFGSAFGAIDGRSAGAESGSLGYIGRANYSYSNKYLAEFLFRTDASTKFAPENYWGKFYSASVGWVISEEDFFKIPVVNFLKVRYSAGLLGRDDTKAWQWRQRYTYQGGKGIVIGNSAATTGMKMEASPNRDATWSDEFKNNLGIDARFLDSRLSATVEVFYNKGTNMLIERTASIPITVGGTVAAENWGSINFFGYELGLGWSDNIGKDFRYGIDTRFGWSDNKIIQGNFANTSTLNPWDAQPGQSDDNGVWGHDYAGMFRTQDEVNAYVIKGNIKSVFGTPAQNLKPGMLYYNDIRGARQSDGTFGAPDGIIDANDQIQLAKKSGNHYGFGTTLKAYYKGFGLDAVISGSFGGWSEIDGASRKKMNNNISRNFQSRPTFWGDIYDVDINPTGRYPNPHWEDINLDPTSNFWRVSSFRMQLRNMNINYSLPKRVTETLRVSNARFFLSALNPVTFFNPFDYKAAEGAYDIFPNLRTFSLGANLTF
ncbi:MAG: TonB-linked outer membrane protein SusC/RagA family [Segetibacter sp.]|nr:TonB-linked outer membrane protein SusC/RagA family [Segetibacter sp.]